MTADTHRALTCALTSHHPADRQSVRRPPREHRQGGASHRPGGCDPTSEVESQHESSRTPAPTPRPPSWPPRLVVRTAATQHAAAPARRAAAARRPDGERV